MKQIVDKFVNGQGMKICSWFYTDNSEKMKEVIERIK